MARITNTETVLIFDVISGKLNSAASWNHKNNKQKYIIKVKYFYLIVLANLTISTASL
jgi:ABC-type uncharacterized transport system YnjBCD substrate-binding protein